MLYFILFLIVVSALLDRYIIRGRLSHTSRTFKAVYCVAMGAIYVGLFGALTFKLAAMSELLWVVFVFFMQAFAKVSYFMVAMCGRLAPRYNNKGGVFDTLAIVAALAVVVVMSWGTFYVRNHPRVERVVLESNTLPEAFDGYTVAFFSDLHVGSLPDNNRLVGKLVDGLNQSGADVVVFGGDLVNIVPEEVSPEVAKLLSGIKAKDGVYSVLGNHDLGIYVDTAKTRDSGADVVRRMVALQKSLGWKLLENKTDYLHRGDDSIALSGINFPPKGMTSAGGRQTVSCDVRAVYDSVPTSMFNILVSHTPEVWPAMAALDSRADITLSGHVHAMQAKAKIAGMVITPASLLYDFVSGEYRSSDIDDSDLEMAKEWAGVMNVNPDDISKDNLKREGVDKMLYINDGFGYVLLPTRVGCAPEITLITLKKPR